MGAALAAAPSVGLAQSDNPKQEPLRVEITAPGAQEQWRETPASVSVVSDDETRGAQDLSLEQSLQRIPGVFAQNRFNAAQGLRLSIRGFGARGNFGVRGVRVLLDGVPLTLPDGQTDLDALDLGLLDHLEVIRGPASTLYGNGAGGVLSIHTRPASTRPHALADISAGDFGFKRLRLEAGGAVHGVSTLAAINATRLPGFRDNSRVDSEIYTGKLAAPFAAGVLRTNFEATEIDSQDPGGLTRAQVSANRSQAAPRNLLYNSGESVSQQRLSWLWQGTPKQQRDYSLSAYVGHRDFDNRLPFTGGGQVAFSRIFGGADARYTRRIVFLGLAQQLTGGFNLEAQQDDRDRFDNLNGVRGARTLKQQEKATSWGVFGLNEVALSRAWNASFGVRYDRVRLSVDDDFLSDGNDSGARDFDDFSFSGGLSYAFLNHQQVYARVATSFATPTNGELANPSGGGFNPDLDSSTAVNYELGVKGERRNLRYEAVIFTIELKDELVGFELPGQSGRSFFRNAGKSRRNGVELSADWQLQRYWRLSAAYTYSDYEFKDFSRDGMEFNGNDIPGIPRQQFFGEIAFERNGYYARLNTNVLDRQYADDANSARVSGYGLLNARLGVQSQGGAWQVEPYVGIDNIFDTHYNDNVRINATQDRYFEPAPGRFFYAGIRASLR